MQVESIMETPVADGRWVWIPDCEEIPTTLQIGIVASDGVIIASDRHTIHAPNLAHIHPYRTSHRTSKMFDSGNGLVCCGSGTEWAIDAASMCAGMFAAGMTAREAINESRNDAMRRAVAIDPTARFGMRGALLVACRENGRVSLWYAHLRLIADTIPEIPIEIDDYKCAGDDGVGGVFFAERYAPRYDPRIARRPMADLKLLVAHVINEGGKMNQGGISGLEIMLCPHGDQPFDRIESGELGTLLTRSDALHERIRSELFPAV